MGRGARRGVASGAGSGTGKAEVGGCSIGGAELLQAPPRAPTATFTHPPRPPLPRQGPPHQHSLTPTPGPVDTLHALTLSFPAAPHHAPSFPTAPSHMPCSLTLKLTPYAEVERWCTQQGGCGQQQPVAHRQCARVAATPQHGWEAWLQPSPKPPLAHCHTLPATRTQQAITQQGHSSSCDVRNGPCMHLVLQQEPPSMTGLTAVWCTAVSRSR